MWMSVPSLGQESANYSPLAKVLPIFISKSFIIINMLIHLQVGYGCFLDKVAHKVWIMHCVDLCQKSLPTFSLSLKRLSLILSELVQLPCEQEQVVCPDKSSHGAEMGCPRPGRLRLASSQGPSPPMRLREWIRPRTAKLDQVSRTAWLIHRILSIDKGLLL